MKLTLAKSVPAKLSTIISLVVLISSPVRAQFLMDMVDTSKDMGKNMLGLYQKFNLVKISGYMQPQFQVIQEKGAKTFAGPDFSTYVNNRFTLRRGRFRIDYARFNKNDKISFQFVFQFDGSERGVNVRDLYGRIFENRWEVLALATGAFARPFGYEVNLSSSDRESPERGRMSQILMKTERDLGAMVSFEPRKQNHPLKWLKVDAGLFNGQGLTGVGEYDSYKDFIARAAIKPQKLSANIKFSAGISFLNGGFMQNSKYHYAMKGAGFVVDSNTVNIGTRAPRHYAGADMQWEFKRPKGSTVARAEYWQGTQTAYGGTSETPGVLTTDAIYTRKFNGAFFYLLHTMGKHQLGLKYDWYDPNTKVSGNTITKSAGNFHNADIKYNTIGMGYTNFINENLKLVLWYEFVKNESTLLDGYTKDLRDNVFTCRMQFRF
jgi:hypothetical protein